MYFELRNTAIALQSLPTPRTVIGPKIFLRYCICMQNNYIP